MSHPTDLLWLEVKELSYQQRNMLEQHLMRCPSCARERRGVADASALLRVPETDVPVRPFARATDRRGVLLAALGAAVVCFVVAITALGVGTEVPLAPGNRGAAGAAGVQTLTTVPGLSASLAAGQPMPELEWTSATGSVARLRDGVANSAIVAFWSADCRSCYASAASLTAQTTAAGVHNYAVYAVVSGARAQDLTSFAQDHPWITTISDPSRLSGVVASSQQSWFLVVSADRRTAGTSLGATGLQLDSLLARARTMANPPIVGEVDSINANTVAVRLESPMMSARYGTPALFRIESITRSTSADGSPGSLDLQRGDRIRLAWADESFDSSTRSYIALTIGRQ